MRTIAKMALVLCSLIFIFTCAKNDQSNAHASGKMELIVISDFGTKEELISKEADTQMVAKTMGSLDWYKFHQVLLEKENKDYIEVGGSLDPGDGLSVLYQENGNQHVIRIPPATVAEMTEILKSYLLGDGKWKTLNLWD